MEHFLRMEKEKRIIEYFVLVIYTLYSISISMSLFQLEDTYWLLFAMTFSVSMCWACVLSKFKTFTVRAFLVSFALLLTTILYSFNAANLLGNLVTFLCVIMCISLYGSTEILYLSYGALVFYYVVNVIECIKVDDMDMVRQIVYQFGNLLIFFVAITILIKGRKYNADANQEIIREMTKAQRSKDDFLANVSHELRTPVNTIYGIAQSIQQGEDPAKVEEDIADMQVASRNLMRMVSDILDFSELQSDLMDVEEEVYDITSTIQDVVNMAVAQINEKDLELIVDFSPNTPRQMLGDEKKIRRIILNLVSNAVKFTKSGFVSITVKARKESYGVNLFVSVQDTGVGMKDEDVEKLFSGFEQVDSRRSRRAGGLGLGLAISRLLAKKMGGVISVTSKENKGSTFTLVVPQKVVNDAPAVELRDASSVKAACYFNVKYFQSALARDLYADVIRRIVDEMGISCHVSQNLDELKRRMGFDPYTHVFIGCWDYMEDVRFFEELATKCRVVVVMDDLFDVKQITAPVQLCQKPFYSLNVASILNSDEQIEMKSTVVHQNHFVAPNAKILIVDDNLMNIKVVMKLLEKYQIQCVYAMSGVEALEKIESMDYDFVFMDHMMPEMDGVETCHRIREKMGAYYKDVPIIALTANAVAGSREMFLNEGMNDFLEKPVELSVLERILKRNLPEEKLIYGEVERVQSLDGEDKSKQPSKSKESVSVMDVQEDTEMSLAGFDVETGSMYCGGIDGLKMIITECVLSTGETIDQLNESYVNQDWKEYVIRVHGLKSTLKSIGVLGISDEAKELEFAGKQEEYDIIIEKHETLMAHYKTMMEAFAKDPEYGAELPSGFVIKVKDACKSGEADSADAAKSREESNKPALSQETGAQLSAAFEDAMYSLDIDAMQSVVNQLKTYNCSENDLNKMERKISQGDYFSAGDMLAELVAKL